MADTIERSSWATLVIEAFRLGLIKDYKTDSDTIFITFDMEKQVKIGELLKFLVDFVGSRPDECSIEHGDTLRLWWD